MHRQGVAWTGALYIDWASLWIRLVVWHYGGDHLISRGQSSAKGILSPE
jgi:hypothetical protein